MTPFATVDQLLLGWDGKEMSAAEEEAAEELLLRATAQLTSMLAQKRIAIDAEDEVQATNLTTVCCNMVRRAMGGGGADGVSSMQQTIASTSATVTFANPDGAFYLSKLDKLSLGLLGSGGYRSVRARTYADGE